MTPRRLPWQTRWDGSRWAMTSALHHRHSSPIHHATNEGQYRFRGPRGCVSLSKANRGSQCDTVNRLHTNARGPPGSSYTDAPYLVQVLATPLRNQVTLRPRNSPLLSQPPAQHHLCQEPPCRAKDDQGVPSRVNPSLPRQAPLQSSRGNFLLRPVFPRGRTPQGRKASLPMATPAPSASSARTHAALAQSHLGHELCVDLRHRRGHDFLGLSWSRHGSTPAPLRWERKARSERRWTDALPPGSGCGCLPTPGQNLRPGKPQPSQSPGERVQQHKHSPRKRSGTEPEVTAGAGCD